MLKHFVRNPIKPSMSLLRGLVCFIAPFARYKFLGQISPLLAGYKVTHKCNLKCLHCPYWKRVSKDQNFEGVVQTMSKLRDAGVRILILEGGEPLLWHDGTYNIYDVVHVARKFFPSVCITTNGTIPWRQLPLNRVWVSLDGAENMHDHMRGQGVFQKVLTNIDRADFPQSVYVSTTVSTLNITSIPELIAFLKGRIGGVTVQFYYPYLGLPDPLYVKIDDRKKLLDRLIDMKRSGYPIVNTVSSLTALKWCRWPCEDRFLANADPDGTISHGCYLKNRGPSVCELCGFTAHNEMTLALRGNLSSICTGLRTFFS